MASTLLLDVSQWDLALDASGNIALAGEPYSLGQDAASAIKTFLGEVWWNTTIGVPYSRILGQRPSLSLIKYLFVQAALTVPDVASAKCFLSEITDRNVAGQIQVTSASTGQTAIALFSATNPQGIG